MKRKIIRIEQSKCNGCGLCASACHEGAIEIRDGKAYLIKDDYCDGLGDCLPVCPTNAISFEEREAAPYNEAAVQKHMKNKPVPKPSAALPCGCPGSAEKERKIDNKDKNTCEPPKSSYDMESQLRQWPVQIKLVNPSAAFFAGKELLIAADCTAYAYGNFHQEFMKHRITLIGCPKLDEQDYTDKLTAIIANNDITKVTAVRMEVPCCAGIAYAAEKAVTNSGKSINCEIVTISTDGIIL